MLPHVDLFLPVHNLKSLVDLAHALNQPPIRAEFRKQEQRRWK